MSKRALDWLGYSSYNMPNVSASSEKVAKTAITVVAGAVLKWRHIRAYGCSSVKTMLKPSKTNTH